LLSEERFEPIFRRQTGFDKTAGKRFWTAFRRLGAKREVKSMDGLDQSLPGSQT